VKIKIARAPFDRTSRTEDDGRPSCIDCPAGKRIGKRSRHEVGRFCFGAGGRLSRAIQRQVDSAREKPVTETSKLEVDQRLELVARISVSQPA